MNEIYFKIKNLKKVENIVEKKNSNRLFKIPFECPNCHWIVRREKPDKQHPIPSTTKPDENNIASDVLVQDYICRNPRCQKPFDVFWFKAKDFYNRI